MEQVGIINPDTPADARRIYQNLTQPANVIVKEVSRALALDPQEYDSRVGDDVVHTAQDALFASLLTVTVGTVEEYRQWQDSFDGDINEIGNPNVDNVVWHVFDGTAIAATFQNQRDAAIATLQRQAFGELYRHLLREQARL